jgi:hypothetical protein
MIYHILNGDAMVERFKEMKLPGNMLVMRECLVEGDLRGNSLDDFILHRTRYLAGTYHTDPDHYAIEDLIEAIHLAPDHSEFNLWFEYDLFCQANLWFILSLIHTLTINKKVCIIYSFWSTPAARWRGFGPATTSDLLRWYDHKIPCTSADLSLASAIWNSYKVNDLDGLEELASVQSACFPYLEEVLFAHIDRFELNGLPGRPEKRIIAIIEEFPQADFAKVFKEFSRWEGVYGFGDAQVRTMWEKIKQ